MKFLPNQRVPSDFDPFLPKKIMDQHGVPVSGEVPWVTIICTVCMSIMLLERLGDLDNTLFIYLTEVICLLMVTLENPSIGLGTIIFMIIMQASAKAGEREARQLRYSLRILFILHCVVEYTIKTMG